MFKSQNDEGSMTGVSVCGWCEAGNKNCPSKNYR